MGSFMKSFAITIVLGIWANNSFAMRCGNVIIDSGDSRLKVTANCGAPTYTYQGGIFPGGGNVEMLVYKNTKGDGMTYKIKLINDAVVSIDGDRE